ncbi:hypothetical protein [Psychrobacter sanguinis]|uniref:hypothetical protein n=1 Tax=Psychrobacter sanguinis TaxID=861445 RepID=UPI00020C9364|nr:hypothetical protein [Psychrobacter sanguinis]EGK14716.1 hypothetical protein HMPREF9373_0658 [Psychrobacter sp. 1501(2011)]MCD9150949.1 hypothetical protein [Psychrobacter sanguinis]
MKKSLIAVGILALLAQGCATPHVVQTTKATDTNLSCKQIVTEISEAERFEKEARDDRKVTGTNVAAAVLFWPALIGTYANTEEAIDAAKLRRENLTKLHTKKSC